jgi:hypothetical protein
MSPALPEGHLRILSYATFANTVGPGLWTAGVALFLTRSAGLPAAAVGAGLTVAGIIGLAASVHHDSQPASKRKAHAAITVCLS